MSAYMLFDGTNVVSMYPEWDFKLEDHKIENVHRTRLGNMYRYKWGSYKRVKFSVEHLSSSDMCRVNSWWGANTPLRLFDTSSVLVCSAYLVNNTVPIGQMVSPYVDKFKGVIELETY